MAIFNPTPQPVTEEKYLGYSKPIEQPGPDLSSAYALKTVGNAIETGVTDADTLVKKSLDDKIHSAIDAERDKYTENLNEANDLVRGGSKTLLAQAGPNDTPPPLQNLTPTLSNLSTARANDKLSETAYYGRLDALSKDFRSRYPGYRDYIDQQFEKVTGVTPANAYIKSIIGDINSFTAATKSEREKDINFAREMVKEGLLDPSTYLGVEQGRVPISEMYKVVWPRLQENAQFKYNKSALEDFKGSQDLLGINYTKVYADHFNKQNADILNEVLVNGGINTQNAQIKFKDLMEGYQKGTYKIEGPQAEQLATMVQGLRDKAYSKSWADANVPDKNGNTLVSLKGADTVNAMINASLRGMDDSIKSLRDKDAGAAFATARINKAIAQEDLSKILNMPDGQIIRGLNAVKDLGPQFVQKVYTDYLSTHGEKESAAIFGIFSQMAGQPDMRILGIDRGGLTSDQQIQGEVYTMQRALDVARTNNFSSDFTKKLVEFPQEVILHPTVPDAKKVGAIVAVFDPKNEKTIRMFEKDAINPNGTVKPGQYAIFTNWTSPQMSAEIKRLSDRHPEVWNMYKNWTTNTFNQLFQDSIKDIDQIENSKVFKIAWDDKKHRFDAFLSPQGASDEETKMALRNSRPVQNRVQWKLDRINAGVNSVFNVLNKESNDPSLTSALIYRMLQNQGLTADSIGNKMSKTLNTLGAQ